MEDTLREMGNQIMNIKKTKVLILVLMEDTLRDIHSLCESDKEILKS